MIQNDSAETRTKAAGIIAAGGLIAMQTILVVNAGSSSLKYALYGPGESSSRLLSGKLERIGEPGGPANHAACVEPLLAQVSQSIISAVDSVQLIQEDWETLTGRTASIFHAGGIVGPTSATTLLAFSNRSMPFGPAARRLPARAFL